PLGQSVTGLPIGIQLSAKFGREDVLLSVAKHLEETPLWMRF
ncbi:MAG: 6-aminohexanoate-cyclic-dimer hydrolase, partial [Pseudomonadota bacterium]